MSVCALNLEAFICDLCHAETRPAVSRDPSGSTPGRERTSIQGSKWQYAWQGEDQYPGIQVAVRLAGRGPVSRNPSGQWQYAWQGEDQHPGIQVAVRLAGRGPVSRNPSGSTPGRERTSIQGSKWQYAWQGEDQYPGIQVAVRLAGRGPVMATGCLQKSQTQVQLPSPMTSQHHGWPHILPLSLCGWMGIVMGVRRTWPHR